MLLALAARTDVELDPLAFVEVAIPLALDRRVVDKDVGATLTTNESVTLLAVEPLHRACFHDKSPSRSVSSTPCRMDRARAYRMPFAHHLLAHKVPRCTKGVHMRQLVAEIGRDFPATDSRPLPKD